MYTNNYNLDNKDGWALCKAPFTQEWNGTEQNDMELFQKTN